jgi:hypothetical protein
VKGVAVNHRGQNHFAFDPTDSDPTHIGKGGYPGGPGYVWHCHIIDHEDNEMMRPWMPSNVAGNRYPTDSTTAETTPRRHQSH